MWQDGGGSGGGKEGGLRGNTAGGGRLIGPDLQEFSEDCTFRAVL